MMIEEHDAPTKILVPDGATHFASEMQRIRNKSDVMPRALMERPFPYTRIEYKNVPDIKICGNILGLGVFSRALME